MKGVSNCDKDIWAWLLAVDKKSSQSQVNFMLRSSRDSHFTNLKCFPKYEKINSHIIWKSKQILSNLNCGKSSLGRWNDLSHKEKLYQSQKLKPDFLMACPALLNFPPMVDICHHMLLSISISALDIMNIEISYWNTMSPWRWPFNLPTVILELKEWNHKVQKWIISY